MDILSLLFIVFLSISICSWRKIKIERAIIISIAIIILSTYIGGILGNFLFGFIPISILLGSGTIFCLFTKRVKKDLVCTSGLYFILITFLITMIYHHNSVVNTWDSFNYWATSVKNMFYNNQFMCAAGNSLHRCDDYFPGIQIFSYIWLKIGNVFSDQRLFISYNMFGYLFLATFLTEIKGKLKTLGVSLVLLSASFCFFYNGGSMIRELQIDALIAIMFGYLLYLLYTESGDDLDIFAGILLLCFSKQVGMLLSLVIVGLLFIRFVYYIRVKKNAKSNLIRLIVPIIEIATIYLSWSFVLSKYAIHSNGVDRFKTVLEQGFSYFKNLEEYQITGFRNFWLSFFKYDIISQTSQTAYYFTPFLRVPGILWLIILCIALILITKKSSKKYLFWYNGLVFVGFLAYMLFISSLYLLLFSKGENGILSSAVRYTSTYLLGIYLLVIILILRKTDDKVQSRINWITIILCLIIPCNNIETSYVSLLDKGAREQKQQLYEKRREEENQMASIIDIVGTNAYIIMDNKYYVDNAKYNYLLYPNKVPLWGYISQLHPKYTHIILNFDSDDMKQEYIDDYGPYFAEDPVEDAGIYSIDLSGEIPRLNYLGKYN